MKDRPSLAQTFWAAARRLRASRAAPSTATTTSEAGVQATGTNRRVGAWTDGGDVSAPTSVGARPASASRPGAQAATGSGEMQAALARLDAIRAECRRLVVRRASLSAGVAVVPLPGLDLGGDVVILLKLLPRINERFGLTPAQIEALDTETKRIVMMFIGSVGPTLVGRVITRDVVTRMLMKMGVRLTTAGIVKFVPLAGQALSATISFGAMKMLGDRHVDDCYDVARRALLASAAGQDAAMPVASSASQARTASADISAFSNEKRHDDA